MNLLDRTRILNRAKKIGSEELAKRLIDEGRSEQQITDKLLKEAARYGHDKGVALKDISDDMLARGLINPVGISLD